MRLRYRCAEQKPHECRSGDGAGAVPGRSPRRRTLLRFSTTIVVGGERFELVADRPDTGSFFTARQRVYRSDGSSSDLPVAAQMVFAGDGHSHWHVRNLESYVLERLDNGVKVGTDAKSGFCFLDTDPYRLALPGAPQTARYDGSGCGTQSALTPTMGLSVGWEWPLRLDPAGPVHRHHRPDERQVPAAGHRRRGGPVQRDRRGRPPDVARHLAVPATGWRLGEGPGRRPGGVR